MIASSRVDSSQSDVVSAVEKIKTRPVVYAILESGDYEFVIDN